MSVITEALRQAERENRHRGSVNVLRGDRPSHGNIVDLPTEPAARPALFQEAGEKSASTGGRASNSRIVIVCAAAGLLILLPTTVGRVFREPFSPVAAPTPSNVQRPAGTAPRNPGATASNSSGDPESLVETTAAAESKAQPVFERRPQSADADEAKTAMVALKYSLKGVMFGDGEAVAIINGVAVCVGDRIDQAEVIGIGTGQVRLREHNVVFSVRLGAEDRSPRR